MPTRHRYGTHPLDRSNKLREWIVGLRGAWREKGPLHFSTMVIERLVSPRVFDFGIIRIVGLDLPDSLPEEDAFAEIRWAGPEDLDRLSQLGIPRPQLETRFEQGQEALVRENAGRLATYMWIDRTRIELTLFRLAMRPGDVYGFDSRTARDLRGHHLSRPLVRYCLRALHEMGKPGS